MEHRGGGKRDGLRTLRSRRSVVSLLGQLDQKFQRRRSTGAVGESDEPTVASNGTLRPTCRPARVENRRRVVLRELDVRQGGVHRKVLKRGEAALDLQRRHVDARPLRDGRAASGRR